jgi:glycerol-3-phosphate dehydrogenase (NAD(P)+)
VTAGRISIVGAGAWGTALANVLAAAGHEIVLWMRDADQVRRLRDERTNERYLPGVRLQDAIRPTAHLDETAGSRAVLLVTPAQSTREVGSALARFVGETPLVLCSKGFERRSGAFLSDVVRECLPGSPVAVLSGPSFAADVARGLPTAVTLACRDAALAEDLAGLLSGRTFRVYHRTDVRGVEIGGAAKNVLAIACGAVAGRGLGESAKAALVARGFAELLRFSAAFGADPETLMGLSGLGDLVLTCSSRQSRNFAFGERLGQGVGVRDAAAGQLAEGAFTAAALVALARRRDVEMPIAESVDAVIAGRSTLDEVIDALLQRPLKREH